MEGGRSGVACLLAPGPTCCLARVPGPLMFLCRLHRGRGCCRWLEQLTVHFPFRDGHPEPRGSLLCSRPQGPVSEVPVHPHLRHINTLLTKARSGVGREGELRLSPQRDDSPVGLWVMKRLHGVWLLTQRGTCFSSCTEHTACSPRGRGLCADPRGASYTIESLSLHDTARMFRLVIASDRLISSSPPRNGAGSKACVTDRF